mmetsp:Transcript_15601/g.25999  ORF Transcript_15601/g.25999 Transcript_15601/m.25999 type:complete len:469 (+) Transcript_15601:1182-2588(+)
MGIPCCFLRATHVTAASRTAVRQGLLTSLPLMEAIVLSPGIAVIGQVTGHCVLLRLIRLLQEGPLCQVLPLRHFLLLAVLLVHRQAVITLVVITSSVTTSSHRPCRTTRPAVPAAIYIYSGISHVPKAFLLKRPALLHAFSPVHPATGRRCRAKRTLAAPPDPILSPVLCAAPRGGQLREHPSAILRLTWTQHHVQHIKLLIIGLQCGPFHHGVGRLGTVFHSQQLLHARTPITRPGHFIPPSCRHRYALLKLLLYFFTFLLRNGRGPRFTFFAVDHLLFLHTGGSFLLLFLLYFLLPRRSRCASTRSMSLRGQVLPAHPHPHHLHLASLLHFAQAYSFLLEAQHMQLRLHVVQFLLHIFSLLLLVNFTSMRLLRLGPAGISACDVWDDFQLFNDAVLLLALRRPVLGFHLHEPHQLTLRHLLLQQVVILIPVHSFATTPPRAGFASRRQVLALDHSRRQSMHIVDTQ